MRMTFAVLRFLVRLRFCLCKHEPTDIRKIKTVCPSRIWHTPRKPRHKEEQGQEKKNCIKKASICENYLKLPSNKSHTCHSNYSQLKSDRGFRMWEPNVRLTTLGCRYTAVTFFTALYCTYRCGKGRLLGSRLRSPIKKPMIWGKKQNIFAVRFMYVWSPFRSSWRLSGESRNNECVSFRRRV